jgi:hypothetical protein
MVAILPHHAEWFVARKPVLSGPESETLRA